MSVRLSCLTTTMPVHDSNITTTLASGPLPSLNMTEHPSSTTAPLITDLPIGQQAIGQEQQQPAFIPNNAPEVPNDGAASVLIVPTTALSSFQTMPQRFQMMEQPLFQRAVIVPTTVLSLIFKQLEMKSNDCSLEWILYVSIPVQPS